MKSKLLLTLVLCTSLPLIGLTQDSSKKFGFELSSGASFATGKLGDANLNTGFGFEGIFHYRFMPHTGIYAGWGWNRFGSKSSFAGSDICFEETGYVFGLQFKHPIKTTSIDYYLRAAGLYNHIEIENEDGDIIGDTKHGFGFQLAGGVDIKLGSNWSLTPGFKFNALSRDVKIGGVTTKLNQNYISVRVGIQKNF